MKILNQNTPTGELNDVKIGDWISNGIGTFGEVEDIKFETGDDFWEFIFSWCNLANKKRPTLKLMYTTVDLFL